MLLMSPHAAAMPGQSAVERQRVRDRVEIDLNRLMQVRAIFAQCNALISLSKAQLLTLGPLQVDSLCLCNPRALSSACGDVDAVFSVLRCGSCLQCLRLH